MGRSGRSPWPKPAESEEIDVVERSFRLVRHKRQKYTCRCGECIDTALGPPRLIPGGRYSVDFAVAVAVAKYGDHMPLARQVRQMARWSLATDTQTLWDQLHALYRHLGPTADALHALVLASPVIAADETRWPLLATPGASKWHAWSVTSPEAISYRIRSSRSATAAREVLGDYVGIVVVDGYSAYKALRDERAQVPDGPPFPLDTNAVERGLRAVVIGRKNHYGSRSERGTRVAALFYTLIESAKLAGVEPAVYLAEATRRAIANPGTVTLPHDLAGG